MDETEIRGYGAVGCLILAIIMTLCQCCSPYSQTSMKGNVFFRNQIFNWELGMQDTIWTPKPIYSNKTADDNQKSMRILQAEPLKNHILVYDPKYIKPWDWRLEK